MSESGVTPQIILGDLITAIGAEPIRSGLAKYNVHDHQRATFCNFYSLGVRPGEAIKAISECDEPLLENDTYVVRLSKTALEMSTIALETKSNLILEIGDKTIYNAQMQKDSAVVTVSATHGFIDGSVLNRLAVENISGVMHTPGSTYVIPILMNIPSGGYVEEANFMCHTGSVSFELKVINSNGDIIKDLGEFFSTDAMTSHNYSEQEENNDSYINEGEGLAFHFLDNGSNSILSYSIKISKEIPYPILSLS
jgi:hypothetical protein